jgi:hypothetical protein
VWRRSERSDAGLLGSRALGGMRAQSGDSSRSSAISGNVLMM